MGYGFGMRRTWAAIGGLASLVLLLPALVGAFTQTMPLSSTSSSETSPGVTSIVAVPPQSVTPLAPVTAPAAALLRAFASTMTEPVRQYFLAWEERLRAHEAELNACEQARINQQQMWMVEREPLERRLAILEARLPQPDLAEQALREFFQTDAERANRIVPRPDRFQPGVTPAFAPGIDERTFAPGP